MEYVIRVSVNGRMPRFVLCDFDLMTPLDLARRENVYEIYRIYLGGTDLPEYSYTEHKLSQLGAKPLSYLEIFTSEEEWNRRFNYRLSF